MAVAGTELLRDRYTIDRVLRDNSLRTIYMAHEAATGRPVAIKQVHAADMEARVRNDIIARFEREAEILIGLRHPGIAQVLDCFVLNQDFFMVLELVHGETLQALLDAHGGGFPPSQVWPWMDQTGDILHYLHTHDPPVVFRDLRPANLMLDAEGFIRLIDFGLARLLNQPSLTKQMRVMRGTPGYAPIEQYGSMELDARADLYALGATIYHLITGYVPPEALARAFDGVALPLMRQYRADVTDAMEAVVGRLMALRRDGRFDTMARAHVALRAAFGPRLCSCGEVLEEGERFCCQCGRPVPCASCGTPVAANHRYYMNCGRLNALLHGYTAARNSPAQ